MTTDPSVLERVARAIAAEVGRQDHDERLEDGWVADGIFKWNLVAQAALDAADYPATIERLSAELERVKRDLGEVNFLHDALAKQIETALGTPGGNGGGFPARIAGQRAMLVELRSHFHEDGRCQIIRRELIERIDAALIAQTQSGVR